MRSHRSLHAFSLSPLGQLLDQLRSPLLGLLLGLLAAVSAHAVEVDDIRGFHVPLKDATAVINREVNARLQTAASKSRGCSRLDFEDALVSTFMPVRGVSRIFFGDIETFVEKSPEIERYRPVLEESIYAQTPFARNMIVIAGSWFQVGNVFASIRIGSQTIGVDKLSHFFETGHDLYQDYFKGRSQPDFDAFLRQSVHLEESHLGWVMTGIKSYADINAHLQGALFWRDLLSEKSPYWSCNEGRVQLRKKFDLTEHVHAGWSEAINCNNYADKAVATALADLFTPDRPSFQEQVRINVAALEKAMGLRHTCPVAPRMCEDAIAAARTFLPEPDRQLALIISPECLKN